MDDKMLYFVLLPDGAADLPTDALGGLTPLQAARKPEMDRLAAEGTLGRVRVVPEGMTVESDPANLSILGYDPRVYLTGRSPLEAMSIGLEMGEDDVAFRFNLVTLQGEGEYEDLIMLDHSAGDIPNEDAAQLVAAVQAEFGQDGRNFHAGVSYRNCLIWRDPPYGGKYDFARPHNILGQKIGEYLPYGETGAPYRELMRRSWEILRGHPVNQRRAAEGKNPGNSIWLWSPGRRMELPDFGEKYGVRGAVVGAVDLIRGIGRGAGMEVISVPGATGSYPTDFAGKGEAAVAAFRRGFNFVFVHIEAPDECGHRGEPENKVRSIERIDAEILAPVRRWLDYSGKRFRILTLPDHLTPTATRTHAAGPVPYALYDSGAKPGEPEDRRFTEADAAATGVYIDDGTRLMDVLIGN